MTKTKKEKVKEVLLKYAVDDLLGENSLYMDFLIKDILNIFFKQKRKKGGG